MDQLEALRTFIAVAEVKSFAEAARKRGISPTAASRAIGELESHLGTVLLRRTTRSVQLTPEGESYLTHCRNAVAELDDAARALQGGQADPWGVLLVTAPVVFGRMKVLPVVTRLMQAHPALDIRLMLSDRIVRLVDEGIDVAVRIADLSDSALHAVRIGETRRVLVASRGYLKKRGTPRSVADLHAHSLIAFDNFLSNGEWRFAGDARATIRFEPRLFTNSMEAALDAALAGAGITRALSYQVEADVAAGRLVYVLPAFDPPPAPISLLFQANRSRAPNVRAFIAAMKGSA